MQNVFMVGIVHLSIKGEVQRFITADINGLQQTAWRVKLRISHLTFKQICINDSDILKTLE